LRAAHLATDSEGVVWEQLWFSLPISLMPVAADYFMRVSLARGADARACVERATDPLYRGFVYAELGRRLADA
jgi:hypothetical protein